MAEAMIAKSRAARVPASTRKTRSRSPARRSQCASSSAGSASAVYNQLEETAPCVLGVGQAGGRDYSVGAAEEVPDLDGDEGYEKQIEQAQDSTHLADAEREDVRAPHGQVISSLREQRDPQRARGDPGEHQGEEEMSKRLRHVETEEVREEGLEDGVGGREEGAEEKQEGAASRTPRTTARAEARHLPRAT